ncbi:RAD9, HUS1, RAD1-interacting nuclear orphan protein 1 [Sorex fumeus]|uniref:RAD9, HUS1, RAD1-interacting nuclear orphan protein 1 n=1 Tax=Sorex fumeus TaxID=62283 RepID=UPI0024AC96EF|nr:RAD9, HUS1, RAD1-interacting nuclear orphan protein 1 [Sorex fumeus]
MPPRRRKRAGPAQRAPLLFHEPPLEGPRRLPAAPPRPVTQARTVPSRPIDASTITSWVTPQFDLAADSGPPNPQKRRRRDPARRSSRSCASKFPRLGFESPEPPRSSAARTPSKPSGKGVCSSPLVPVLSPQSQASPGCPHACTLPDIRTPEPAAASRQGENSLPGAPMGTEPGPVLVRDTPEDKYGLKVTWRRRQQLLAFLQDRGKLSPSQVHVKI